MSVQVGNGFSIGSMGMLMSSLAIPAEAPTIAFASKTDTTISMTLTLPGDTSNFSLARFFYATPGGARSEVTETNAGTVTLTGLTSRTHYLIVAVSESAGGAQLGASEILSVYTSPSGSESTTGVDASKVMRTPGRLCVDPTSLSGSFPYGGTALGGARSVSKVVERQVAFAPDLERGGIQESFEGPVRIRLSCILRETNDAVISTLFRSAVTGGVSAEKGIAMPQAADLPGKKGTDRAVKLLWVPLNTADYPAIYIPRAIPVQTTDMSKLGAFSERTRFVEFEAARDASDRLYLEQLIEDMTL